MGRIVYVAVALALVAAVFASQQMLQAWAADKVQICHVPPGNPQNGRVIEIGTDALPAHLGHGDCLRFLFSGRSCSCPETGDLDDADDTTW